MKNSLDFTVPMIRKQWRVMTEPRSDLYFKRINLSSVLGKVGSVKQRMRLEDQEKNSNSGYKFNDLRLLRLCSQESNMGHQKLYWSSSRKFGLGSLLCCVCSNQDGLSGKYGLKRATSLSTSM